MKKPLFLIGILAIAFFLHILTQYRLFSLFGAAMSIPLLLMVTIPFPALLALATFFFLELFSSLPQGSMIAMFAIPYVVLFLWKDLRVDLSWKFFFGITLIVALQTAGLLGIVAFTQESFFLPMPWHLLITHILLTSSGTFVLAFIYHEYSERL